MDHDFTPGDLALTTGSVAPLLNDGALVIVLEVAPTRLDWAGRNTPYFIRRVDGQAFPLTRGDTGERRWYSSALVWCRRDQLLRPDLREGWSDTEAIEQRNIQRQLEAALGMGRR